MELEVGGRWVLMYVILLSDISLPIMHGDWVHAYSIAYLNHGGLVTLPHIQMARHSLLALGRDRTGLGKCLQPSRCLSNCLGPSPILDAQYGGLQLGGLQPEPVQICV